MDENFKSALMTDISLRAKGFGYANTLCVNWCLTPLNAKQQILCWILLIF